MALMTIIGNITTAISLIIAPMSLRGSVTRHIIILNKSQNIFIHRQISSDL